MRIHGSHRGTAGVGIALAIVLGAAPATAAGPIEYSYQVDRFELDGNVLGAKDGVPDFVDEFDDGTLSPNWYQPYGTSSEHDGALFLTSPGVAYPSPAGGTTIVSIVASSGPTYVYDKSGSFSATAYWEPTLPPDGYHYHFSLFTFGGGGSGFFSEIFGVGFGGIDGGLSFEQHRTEIDQSQGIYQNTMLDYVPVDAATITGRIGMRIDFNDATNEAFTSYSVDGGSNWQSPFPHGQVFVGRTTGQFILSADPSSNAPPTPTPAPTPTPTPCSGTCCNPFTAPPKSNLVLTKLSKVGAPQNRVRLTAAFTLPAGARFADLHPEAHGARVVVHARPSGAALVDVSAPAGFYQGPGTQGWSYSTGGLTWTYADKSGAPPNEVARMTIVNRSGPKTPNQVVVKIDAKGNTTSLGASASADALLVLGDDTDAAAGLCGSRTYATQDCSVNAKSGMLHCKY